MPDTEHAHATSLLSPVSPLYAPQRLPSALPLSATAATPQSLISPPMGGTSLSPAHYPTYGCATSCTSPMLICRAVSCMLNHHPICTMAPITPANGGRAHGGHGQLP